MGYYTNPKDLIEMEDFLIGKWFDLLEIEHDLFKRWGE
jgi:4-hydroxy-3-polyprenylbenzoate decarboxylase